MNRSLKFVLPVLAVFSLLLLPAARADDSADRATDIAQMKRVWQALMAYKKANGALPDKLSDLVPEFLSDPKVLVSPKDDGDNQNGPLTLKEDKHPSSYGYEWGSQKFRTLTFKEVKTCQVEEYGPVVPLLRCFLHGKALNISHDGEFYETDVNWEISPAVKEIIAKRGLGPGCSTGRFVELTVIDEKRKPLQGIQVTVSGRFVEGIWLPDRTITTNAEGKVRVPFGPTPVIEGVFSFAGEGYFAAPLTSPEAGFDEKVLITMTGARRAGGIVRDARGKPIAGARIRITKVKKDNNPDPRPNVAIQVPIPIPGLEENSRPDPNEIAIVESSPAGEWNLSSLPSPNEQKFEVTCSHPDFRITKLLVGDGSFTTDLLFAGKGDITLHPPIRLRGVLQDATGQPIQKATVFYNAPPDPLLRKPLLQMPEVKTDESGAFEFPARVPGETEIIALPKGQPPILHKFDLHEDALPLQLSPPKGRKLAGRVLDTAGKPVPDVAIYFNGWPTMRLSEQPLIATSDADGRWTWDNAPPEVVVGSAILPSGNLRHWQERLNTPVEIRIALTERQ